MLIPSFSGQRAPQTLRQLRGSISCTKVCVQPHQISSSKIVGRPERALETVAARLPANTVAREPASLSRSLPPLSCTRRPCLMRVRSERAFGESKGCGLNEKGFSSGITRGIAQPAAALHPTATTTHFWPPL